MHPRYKLTYFQAREWPAEWVQIAEDLTRAAWNRSYKPRSETIIGDHAEGSASSRSKVSSRAFHYLRTTS